MEQDHLGHLNSSLHRTASLGTSIAAPKGQDIVQLLRTPYTRGSQNTSSAHSSEQKEGSEPLAIRADRKSTRLNSSHANISYAVFCLKKKKPAQMQSRQTK